MRLSLLDKLARNGSVFTVEDARLISGVAPEVLWVMLSRMESRGWIERIEKGKYLIVPLGAEKGRYTLHEFVIASVLVEPCCIAYWSALNFHGLTEQMPRTVFVQTTARKKTSRQTVFGVDYCIVRVDGKKIFGTEKHWIEGTAVNVTDPEKTIVDCLDRPRHCGGIVEVAKALLGRPIDARKLIDYSKRINNSGVMRRLGFLADLLELDIDVPMVTTRSYLPLDPSMPRLGGTNARWRLRINVDERELEGLK